MYFLIMYIFSFNFFMYFYYKKENKKFYSLKTVPKFYSMRTVPKSNRIFVRNRHKIDIPNTHTHGRSFSWPDTGTSTKCGGVALVLLP